MDSLEFAMIPSSENKINHYQNYGKTKVWKKKGSKTYKLFSQTSSWACMAASELDSLIFIDEEMDDAFYQFTGKCTQYYWGDHQHAARQRSKTHCQHNKRLHQGKKMEESVTNFSNSPKQKSERTFFFFFSFFFL